MTIRRGDPLRGWLPQTRSKTPPPSSSPLEGEENCSTTDASSTASTAISSTTISSTAQTESSSPISGEDRGGGTAASASPRLCGYKSAIAPLLLLLLFPAPAAPTTWEEIRRTGRENSHHFSDVHGSIILDWFEAYVAEVDERIRRDVRRGLPREDAVRNRLGRGRAERVRRARAALLRQMRRKQLDMRSIRRRFDRHRVHFERHFAPGHLYLAIPFQESRYVPCRISSAGAKGLWQLMPATAADFDLSVTRHRNPGLCPDRDPDERYDPRRSTRAARRFLARLEDEFGSDREGRDLVLAAYHTGPGNVRGLIDHFGTRDFWSWRPTREARRRFHFGTASYAYPAWIHAAHTLLCEERILTECKA